MPIYTITCDKCEKVEEIFRNMADYDDLPDCCGQKTHRIMSATLATPDIQEYRSMIDGSIIGSRSKHRAHLKQHGCIEVGNELKHLQPKPRAHDPRLKETIIRAVNERL